MLAVSLGAAEPAPPVAAWDVVPHQELDKPLHLGVVAFHLRPLNVAFRIDGGGKALLERTVSAPSRNPDTGVWEYVCPLDPATLPDGPFAVQARVSVQDGAEVALDLQPLELVANAAGSLPAGRTVVVDAAHGDDANPGDGERPMRSLKAGLAAAGEAGTVRLRAGSYPAQSLGSGKRTRWTTIRPDDGVPADAVVITPGRPGADKLRFTGLTFAADPEKKGYNTILAGEQGRHAVWIDQCAMVCRGGREMGTVMFGNEYPAYITGGTVMDLGDGPSARLMRGLVMKRICSDAFTGARVAINCTVEVIDRGGSDAHPDFVQSHTGKPDVLKSFILYNCRGLRCGSQGFFGLNVKDSAFVNCLFVKDPPDSPLRSQYTGRMENVLFLHLTLPNQHWHWRGTGPLTRDVAFVNGVVPSMEGADPQWMAGIAVRGSHVVRGGACTADAGSQGDPLFADAPGGDYRPRAGGPLAGGGIRLACVPADIDGEPWPETGVNRGCLRTAP